MFIDSIWIKMPLWQWISSICVLNSGVGLSFSTSWLRNHFENERRIFSENFFFRRKTPGFVVVEKKFPAFFLLHFNTKKWIALEHQKSAIQSSACKQVKHIVRFHSWSEATVTQTTPHAWRIPACDWLMCVCVCVYASFFFVILCLRLRLTMASNSHLSTCATPYVHTPFKWIGTATCCYANVYVYSKIVVKRT